MNLVTDRLLIRDMVGSDAPFILNLLNEPAFHAHIGDKGVRTEEDARAYIKAAATDMYERHGFGMFLVLLKEGSAPIGICGLLQRDFLPHPDLGFAYASDFWNMGFGTEAASAIVNWVKSELKLPTLSAFTSTTNGGSMRVLEKAGFRSLGEQTLAGRTGSSHVFVWGSEN